MALAPARSGHGGVYMPFQRVHQRVHQPAHHHHRSNSRPFTSFFIKDILGSKICGVEKDTDNASTPCVSPISPSSPWSVPAAANTGTPQPSPPAKETNFPVREPEKSLSNNTLSGTIKKDANGSPLSALEELANKTFTGLETSILRAAEAATVTGKRDPLHLFNRQPPRKKRKSRTAFNNQQIFELERRFIYQKYLTPADRDEIASVLGLSNAQVITWFQNRRAKLKRDMEELSMDVTASSVKKSPELNVAPEDAATVASSVATAKASRFKEEDADEDDDEEDRLSTMSEQHQCREQFSLRLATADDNSPHHHHRLKLNTEEEAAPHHGGRDSAAAMTREGGVPMNAAKHGGQLQLDAASCFVSTAACGADTEEVESMDCSTSPSSGFHSDNEDK